MHYKKKTVYVLGYEIRWSQFIREKVANDPCETVGETA